MDQKTLKVLEYNKVKDLLKEEAVSSMAKAKIEALVPYAEKHIIEDELRSTTEAVDLIIHKGPLPIYHLYDIGPSVELARKGSTLSMKQLLEISANIKTSDDTVTFLKGDIPEIPGISSMVALLADMRRLSKEIDRCIISEDEMSDNASSQLKHIRKSIIRLNEDIKIKLNKIITSQDNKSLLQDSIVTMRDGRYVIPVKSEQGYKMPGIVHDRSKGGQTLFVEPQVIVNMNNELREAQLEETAEINRILRALTDGVSEHFHFLMNNERILTGLDYIMAKGKLSRKQLGEEPSISDGGELSIVKGRHPLIDGEKVVPTTFNVGGSVKTLVVTGPNTGGKTVTLKTAGLLTLMAQSGLHIPADGKSNIPIFDSVFADIGDEQSIEQSLSTFSSHMKNIVGIMDKANERSLVLLDELGAGTDPTEGAALAISIMDSLKERGSTTIATTHYNEIKKYALSTEGVENASMEFDVESLSPTYRLIIGVPGRSNAFEISKKLGLNSSLIERATRLIETKDMEFEDVLTAIEMDKKRAEAERDEAIMINLAMKKKQEVAERKLEEISSKREKMLRAAEDEARDIIRQARESAREAQKELRRLEKNMPAHERNRIIENSRRTLKEKENALSRPMVKKVNTNPVSADELSLGQRVKLITLDQNGTVLTLPDNKNELMVQIGNMKIKAKLEDIVIIVDGNEKKFNKVVQKPSKYGNMYRHKAMNVTTSIDVRGKSLDDALIDVEKYIDDAFIAGLRDITVVHGRGEGILREGIRSALKANRHVASISRPKYNEGGEGATNVKLKE